MKQTILSLCFITTLVQQEACDFPTTWLSTFKSHDLKSDSSTFNIQDTQSLEYWQRHRSLSPFDSSDSDSSSDSEDDVVSLRSSDQVRKDASLISEGTRTLNIMESNALGLVFMYEEEDLETKAIATSTLQAESLRAPTNHQDDRSCGRPTPKYHALQEHVAFQLDGTTKDTLGGRFPQDIGLWADISDDTGPEVSKHSNRKALSRSHKA